MDISNSSNSKTNIKLNRNFKITGGNIENNNHLNKNNTIIKNYEKYNDYEINSLSYAEALEIDERNFWQLYISQLRAKHPLKFSFYTSNDYNSKTIKICLFLFSFALYYTTNGLI